MEVLIMEMLIGYFNAEIENKVQEKNGELIVEFDNGKKAKIKLTCLL